MGARPASLTSRCLAEALGTFVLVFFGCGAVHTAVLLGAQAGLWQVAVVWGVAIMLAVFVFGGVSGAHINPAVTVTLAVWGGFPWRYVAPYALSQLGGAFLAAATLFTLFGPFLADKEKKKGVERGRPGSEVTAMCYGEYFPNPGPLAAGDEPYDAQKHAALNALVSEPVAFLAEVIGTLILALVVFALTDERNAAAPTARLAPVFIGLTVAVLISVIAPLTQACFNPARDLGPRLWAWLAGWGPVALPGPRGAGFLTVYLLAPVVGAVAGGGLYLHLVRPALPGPNGGKDASP
jgi:glycerol uptake facilitator protein